MTFAIVIKIEAIVYFNMTLYDLSFHKLYKKPETDPHSGIKEMLRLLISSGWIFLFLFSQSGKRDQIECLLNIFLKKLLQIKTKNLVAIAPNYFKYIMQRLEENARDKINPEHTHRTGPICFRRKS